MDMYDMYQACLSGAVALEENRDRNITEEQHIEEIRFTQDTDKPQSPLEDLLLVLGEIDVIYKKVNNPTSSPVLISRTDTRINEETSDIVNLIVLDVDGTQIHVVTDYGNKCVKSFFTINNKAGHSKISLERGPCGITKLNERQVLVAVPDSRKIVTIEVRSKLRLISIVSTGKEYCSLAILNNTSMVATTWSSVDILNMAGEVMKSFKDAMLFTTPWSVCVTSKGNILVSDKRKKTVTCLTSEGDVVWTYTPDRHEKPRGITTFSTGSSLFAVCGKIVQLTESEKLNRNVLTSDHGLKNPSGAYYDGKGSLFVCDGNHLFEFSIE